MYIYQLSYVSQSVSAMDDQELKDLLTKARQFNVSEQLSGVLIYSQGLFLQLLEGEEEKVNALFDKIKRDPRHKDILVFFENYTKHRIFGNWSMAYKATEDYDQQAKKGIEHFIQGFHNSSVVCTKSEWFDVLNRIQTQQR